MQFIPGSPPFNPASDTIHVLKAGDTMTGPLNIQGSGTIQTWLTSGGDPLGHVDTTLGSLVIPYSAPVGNLYLGQTQIGNGGINYTYDSSVTSPYVAHDFLQVWNGYNATVVASINASGSAVFASIAAPAYVTGDNGYVEVAMGFFSGLPGLYIHDTNGTSEDYMQFVKNNGTYIVQTTWDGQSTFGAYASSAVALIARGYLSSTADIFQIQQWGGVSGASGTVLAKFDYQGNLYIPGFQLSTSPTSGYVLTSDSSGNGTWQSASGVAINRTISSISTATAAGSTVNTDYVYFVSGTTTLTLPTAVGNKNRYTIKNAGSNVVSIATTSSQTIDGSSAPITLPVSNSSLDLVSDNANWRIV